MAKEFQKEYEEYIKKSTDRFIQMLSDDESDNWIQYKTDVNGKYIFGSFISIDTVPEFHSMPAVIEPSDKQKREELSPVQVAWIKEKNRRAVEYLKESVLSYDEWFKNIKSINEKTR